MASVTENLKVLQTDQSNGLDYVVGTGVLSCGIAVIAFGDVAPPYRHLPAYVRGAFETINVLKLVNTIDDIVDGTIHGDEQRVRFIHECHSAISSGVTSPWVQESLVGNACAQFGDRTRHDSRVATAVKLMFDAAVNQIRDEDNADSQLQNMVDMGRSCTQLPLQLNAMTFGLHAKPEVIAAIDDLGAYIYTLDVCCELPADLATESLSPATLRVRNGEPVKQVRQDFMDIAYGFRDNGSKLLSAKQAKMYKRLASMAEVRYAVK